MKIAIVEDEVIVADDLAEILEGYGLDDVSMYHSYEEAMHSLAQGNNAYILDIRLGSSDGDGIDIGIKLAQKKIPFIYITANNEVEIIKKAVQTKPVAYISKPFKERDVIAALELLRSQKRTEEVELNTSKGKITIDANDILFCKADDVYVHVITEDKKYTQRATLKEFSARLTENFVRVHRSYIVNKLKITAKKADCLFVNQLEIPISRSYKGQL